MPLYTNNPTVAGSADADLIMPYNGTGVTETVHAGDGNDTVYGNRLASWVSVGNGNQTYNTAFSIDNPIGWTVGGTANPMVGDPSIPNTTVYAQSTGGYICYSINLAAGAVMTLDIDSARSAATGFFDSFVEVLDSSTGAVLAHYDDSAGATQGGLGSLYGGDSYGQYTAGAAGTYIIRVGRYMNATTSQPLQAGDMFALSVSATGHAANFGATGGNSNFYGEGGDDLLMGYIGNDMLDGGAGDDALYGYDGNDSLHDLSGNDLYDGGAGYDTVIYDGAVGVAVDLRIAGVQNTQGSGMDTLVGIEALSGTSFNDTLDGDGANNGLTGNEGDDILRGWGGNDYIVVGLGADTANGGDGTDTINFAHTNANWTVNAAAGTASNSYGSTVSFGGFEIYQTAGGNDTIYSSGTGEYYAGAGNDVIYAANGSNEKLDGGDGIDTLDISYFGGVYVVNMVTGDTNYGEHFVNFENLIGGGGATTVTGTAGANNIRTGGGADTVNAGDGDDVVEGGGGNDVLDGQNGFDIASYEHAAGGVTVSLALQGGAQSTGGAGSDTLSRFEGLRGSAMVDMLTGDGLANILIGGAGNDVLHGGAGDDVILWLQGDGSDDIDGGADVDTLNLRSATSGWTIDLNPGGTGTNGTDVLTLSGIERIDGTEFNDTITMSNDGGSIVNGYGGDDHISFGTGAPNTADGGDGIDTLDTSTYDSAFGSYTINLQTGTTNYDEGLVNFENLISGDTNDIVTGTAGDNVIKTNGGNDIIEGGLGNDTIDGGDGSDTATYTTAASGVIVRLGLTGPQNTGGGGTDRLTNIENLVGSDYADTLQGNSASNYLDGGMGADSMQGGKGDDFFVVDNAGDVVVEANGEGSDTVDSSVTFSLAGQYVEVLNLTGTGAINGTGNSLNNRIVGNDATNILVGGDGSDRLDGGAGADTMKGGTGNDTYVVDNSLDKIVENDGEGTDTVEASFTYSIAGQYIEILKLMGFGDINGTGNGLSNTLYGNVANNTLNGGAGIDTMYGGDGNDTYIVDNAGDRVFENANEGTDTVMSSVSFAIGGQYVEVVTLTGTAAINATGNSQANVLNGNNAVNVLNGGGGDDALHGGLGSDTLTGGTGFDTYWFETTLGAGNVDTISDFNVADDTIYLDRTIFSAITADGRLDSTAYFQGAAAHDADDRIVYDKATGKIYYDADGNGAGAAVLFAQVTANTALTVSDFFAVP